MAVLGVRRNPHARYGGLKVIELLFADDLEGLLILCLIFHPSRYLPRELSGLRLDAVQLNDVELCNPPTYAESQNTEAPSS